SAGGQERAPQGPGQTTGSKTAAAPPGVQDGAVPPPQRPRQLRRQWQRASRCTASSSPPDCPDSRPTAELTPPRLWPARRSNPGAVAPDGAGAATTTRPG